MAGTLVILGLAALANVASLHAQSQFATYDAAGNLTVQLTSAAAVAPTIVTPPHGELGQLAGSVSFSVVATGTAPLTYEWRLNGNPISVGANPSAATSTLILNNLTPGSFGNYSVKVTNSTNFAVSTDAALQLDSAGDGIPDSWKIAHFGVNWATNPLAAAGADFDGDGISNREEYLDGTDPANASSHFYRLVVTQGQVAVAPAGNRFPLNTVVTLTAASVGGSQFIGWTGDVSSTLNPLVLTMTQNYSVGAVSGIFPLDRPALSPSFTTASGASVLQFAQQADGRTLICGAFAAVSGVPRSGIARLLADGSLDPSFAPVLSAGAVVDSMAIQPADGRVVIGGNFTSVNGVTRFNVARLNTNGTLDTTFDAGAAVVANEIRIVHLQPGSGKIFLTNGYNLTRLTATGTVDAGFSAALLPLNGGVSGIAAQTDLKVVVAGNFTSVNGTPVGRIARLTDTGALDSSFTASATAQVGPLLLRPDGQIYVFNGFGAINGSTKNLVRLNGSNGTLDAGFTLPAGTTINNIDRPGGLSRQADGKILVAGFTSDGALYTSNLARFNETGTLDASLAPNVADGGSVTSIVADGGGNLLVGGFFTTFNALNAVTTQSHIKIARFRASDGLLDAAFGTSASARSRVAGIRVMPDGSSIAWGPFTVVSGVACNYLARLNPDGSLDASFNSGPNSGPDAEVEAFALQPDGKFVVGGNFLSYDNVPLATPYLLRLNPDGSLDSSLALPGPGLNGDVTALAVHPDGRILVSGNFNQIDIQNINHFVRLNPSGTVDGSFTAPPPAVLQSSFAQEITIQSGGGFFLCGSFQVSNVSKTFLRLNDNGSFDPSFPAVAFDGNVQTVLVQPDGRILVGGNFPSLGVGQPTRGIVRLNADGTGDPSFLNTYFNTALVNKMALQSDGSIVAGGAFQTVGSPVFSQLARFNEFGRLDRGFRSDAFPDNTVDAVAIEASGAIVIAGQFSKVGSNGRLAYARFTPATTIQSGTITVTPNQPTYPAGTMVTLSLSPTSSDAPITSVSFESSADGQSFLPLGPGAPQAGGIWTYGVAGLPPGMSYFRALITTARAIQTRSNAVGPLRSPPVVTSALTANGARATPFTYSGTATNPLTSFTATGLPTWANPPTFDPATGILTITGTPDNFGVTYVTLTPTNAAGSTSSTLRIVVGRTYNDWAIDNGLDPLGPATPEGDQSGQGVQNGIRYLLGLGAYDPAAARLPGASIQTLAGGRYLTLTYTRDLTAVDATIAVEITDGLNAGHIWNSGSAFTTEVSRTDHGDGTETVVTRDLLPITVGGGRFMRLHPTFPPPPP